MMESRYLLRSGLASSGLYEVEVTPESAGWGCSSLKIISLGPAGSHRFQTVADEVIVLPLTGSVAVEVGEARCELGGRFALCGARTDSALPLRYLAASQVPVELRGAGQSSRQVRNFGTPGSLDAAKIIACEVITPAGNWSSYPPHKHDEPSETETELEEIYY